MSFDILKKEILSRSKSDTWSLALKEWSLNGVEIADDYGTCLCGHYPIKELCNLKNKLNNNETIVGNCCVNKFLGIKSDKIFRCLRRMTKDIKKSANLDTLAILYEKKAISDWEFNFYSNIVNKRNLTENQLAKKIQINNKVVFLLRAANLEAGRQ